ncbi:MAG TPA: tetratricopeptide repeat protein [Comamonas denitrificans]|nr:tetratricopeptide repeat protein [Comamonas denitrificans]
MSRLALLRLLLPAALLTFTASAQADAHSDVAALIQQGKTTEAIAQAQSYLAQNARDPQMRFLQGSAQSAAGDTQAAITTFTLLTQEYPELPEPYNNLAVLYASQGQLEQARGALLQAVRNNPSYPVAYENLGDIYLRLAHEAFSQATKLQGAQPDVQRKLSGLRPLLQP